LTIRSRFAHVNLIAQDWRRLVEFYERVFGCTPVPPERDLAGQWLAEGTGVRDAHVCGIHLRLPDYSEGGPTIEIFEYDPEEVRPATAPNRPGWGHIAFSVEDVPAARDAVIAAGGGTVGETISVDISGVGPITFAYVTDPEGNIIELQRWSSDQDSQDGRRPDSTSRCVASDPGYPAGA
jgi:catechol 2,3-dioxygenase-like lactoylglutathione lyase family enzyme